MTIAFLDLFNGALSSANAHDRTKCEQQLLQLLHQPNKAFFNELCEYISAPNKALPYRQFACLLIRKFIRAHWSAMSLEDDEILNGAMLFTLDSNSKEEIKHGFVHIVQQSLNQFSDSKSQTAFCMILATVVELEAAESNQIPYEQLFLTIISILSSACVVNRPKDAQLMMDFTTRFLTLSVQNISYVHCCELANILFPHLQKVFLFTSEFHALQQRENAVITCATRCRIVRIVEQILLAIGMEAQVGTEKAQLVLDGYLSGWCESFLKQLESNQQSMLLSVEIQILATFSSFVREWPRVMATALATLYRQVISSLQRSMDAFNRDILLAQSSSDASSSDHCTAELYDAANEGAQLGQEAFVVACIDLFQATLTSVTKSTRDLIRCCIRDVWSILIPFLGISEKQHAFYAQDPNQYIVDEDGAALESNLRRAAIDFLIELLSVFSPHSHKESGPDTIRFIVETAQMYLMQDSRVPHALAWRHEEAALLVLGSVASNIDGASLDILTACLQIDRFTQHLIKLIAEPNIVIYLRCRALCCASHFASVMSSDLLFQFTKLCLSSLAASQSLPVRMYACRAIALALIALEKQETHKSPERQIQIDTIALEALQLLSATVNNCSEENIHIAFESIIIMLKTLGAKIGAEAASFILHGFLQYWQQQLNDTFRLELLQDAIIALLELGDPVIMGAVYDQSLPPIHAILTNFTSANLTDSCTAAIAALSLLQTILQHSCQVWFKMSERTSTDHMVQALSERVIQQLLQPLLNVLELSDDEKVFKTGTECLKCLILFAHTALASPTSESSCIHRIFHIASKLLSLDVDDACATSAGGLITQLLLKYGGYEGPMLLPISVMQAMLSAIASRLCNAELPALVQSLCMVFARLVLCHGKEFIHILEQLPPPQSANGIASTSKNMLEFVFRYWIIKQQNFFGLYCLKVTTKALVDVLDWRDERVLLLSVPHEQDIRVDTAEIHGPRRSRRLQAQVAPPKRDTVIHFVSKLIIVLAKTYSQLQEEEEEAESQSSSSDGDIVQLEKKVSGNDVYLSSMLDEPEVSPEEDSAFEAHFDPLTRINIKQLISTVIQKLLKDPATAHYIQSEIPKQEQALIQNIARSC